MLWEILFVRVQGQMFIWANVSTSNFLALVGGIRGA